MSEVYVFFFLLAIALVVGLALLRKDRQSSSASPQSQGADIDIVDPGLFEAGHESSSHTHAPCDASHHSSIDAGVDHTGPDLGHFGHH